MDKIKRNFGFGCMRLPMIGEDVDIEQTRQMVDLFLKEGFNYFDTAHGYIQGKSELAVRECLTSRYPRDQYILTDKLTGNYFKKEGKIRHVGMSFHDTAEVLDQILTEYPQIEVVQIQFNYLDYEDPKIQSRLCYEVCRKHNKPIIIMEPVKGGSLVNLPKIAGDVLDELQGGSPASYAIRYAAGFPGVMMVLSGMSNMEQMQDNLSYMKNFKPLNEKELKAVYEVQNIFNHMDLIRCTGCRYCVEGCPKQIAIPDIFTVMNARQIHQDRNAEREYRDVHTSLGHRASDCIKCGKCEAICPQHLPIRELLEDIAREFEKQE